MSNDAKFFKTPCIISKRLNKMTTAILTLFYFKKIKMFSKTFSVFSFYKNTLRVNKSL